MGIGSEGGCGDEGHLLTDSLDPFLLGKSWDQVLKHDQPLKFSGRHRIKAIVGRVSRATARNALCRGFDPCWQRIRGVAVDFGPKQSGWLINQLGVPQFSLKQTASGENVANHTMELYPFTKNKECYPLT